MVLAGTHPSLLCNGEGPPLMRTNLRPGNLREKANPSNAVLLIPRRPGYVRLETDLSESLIIVSATIFSRCRARCSVQRKSHQPFRA